MKAGGTAKVAKLQRFWPLHHLANKNSTVKDSVADPEGFHRFPMILSNETPFAEVKVAIQQVLNAK